LVRNKKREVNVKHFRPNILVSGVKPFGEDQWHEIVVGDSRVKLLCVKRCTRCTLTTVDPETGVIDADGEPLKTLMSYRRVDKGAKYKPVFGINAIAESVCNDKGNVYSLCLGDEIRVLKTCEHRIKA